MLIEAIIMAAILKTPEDALCSKVYAIQRITIGNHVTF
jgi:hypothetical protein